MSLWDRDDVQFPRLLAEIRAVGLIDDQYAALEASMDLPRGKIDEILRRAEDAFEKLKPCEFCKDSPLPGILFPTDFDDREMSADGKVWVARHDECGVYGSDVEAAETLSKATGWPVMKSYDRDDAVDPRERIEKFGRTTGARTSP